MVAGVVVVSVVAPPTLKLEKGPPAEVVVVTDVAAGFTLPKSPVPGAIVAVEVPKMLELVVFVAVPNGLCVLEVSAVVESTF